MQQSDAAEVVRRKIAMGELPRGTWTETWAGVGTSHECGVCGRPTRDAGGIEYECIDAAGTTFRFCQPCFHTWHAEREAR